MSKLISRSMLACILLFAVASTARIAYVVFQRTYLDKSHGAEMESAAVDLATHGELGNVFSDDSGKSAHVAPLYAVWLSAIYRVFGLPSENGRLAQQLLAVLVTSAGIALLPLLGEKAGLRPAAGVLAGAMLALSPANLWIETAGSWEQPYAALFLLLLVLLFLELRDREWRAPALVLAAGILLGLTALLAPNLLPAAVLMVVADGILQGSWRRRIVVGSSTMAGIALLIVSPWIVRNYIALGGFVPLRSNFGLELYDGNNSLAPGKTYVPSNSDRDSPMRLMHPIFGGAELAHLKEIGELSYMHEKQHLALQWIAEHPERFTWLCAERFRLFWFPPPAMWDSADSGRTFKSLGFTLLGLGTFAGIACLFWQRNPYRWLLAAATLAPSLVYLVTHVDTRYRYPTFALSGLLTAVAVLEMLSFARNPFRQRFALAVSKSPVGVAKH